MSAGRTVRLDRAINGSRARIMVRLAPGGTVAEAWFDLDGLPRVERLLRGRPIDQVPALIERLCGLCPATHHLAGARALDALAGVEGTTPTAQAVRRLLHHGAVLQAHARALAKVDAGRARTLHSFAHQAVVAAAGGRQVPRCAVPGGVLAPVATTDRDLLAARLDVALEQAADVLAQIEAQANRSSPGAAAFTGYDVALADETGALDLYGTTARVVTAAGAVAIAGAPPAQWPEIVAESRPGATASRPFLRTAGAHGGAYRVGPVAQLRATTGVPTPAGEAARERWAAADGGALWARAVVTVHAVEAIGDLLTRPQLTEGLLAAPTPAARGLPATLAVGWVDGPRGLLVHTYRIDDAGELSDATITTPTAQNEQWLAGMLFAATRDVPAPPGIRARPKAALAQALETAVMTADPCLPCTSLPTGSMGLELRVIDAEGATLARWDLDQDQDQDPDRTWHSSILDPREG